jgi:uncharacterized Fe-S cluster-containing protein
MVNEESRRVIFSSCCHTVNVLVQKYFPEALDYLAPVISPMLAHCLDIKRRIPGAKKVYIGPCISKKAEAESSVDLVDGALTFGELSAWMERRGLSFSPREEDYQERSLTRFFPLPGGILRTMKKQNPRYTYLSIDGIENCIGAVKDVLSGALDNCFIEMSACTGSCTGGPAMDSRSSPVRNYIFTANYAGREDFEVFDYAREALAKTMENMRIRRIRVGDQALEEVLAKIGKTKAEDELNCGGCGYNTCREKALAVLEGKATLTMCLPYLKEKAESFSDHIIRNTPNAVILLNESFEVQQINAAACTLMHIDSPHNILGDLVVRILDPLPFFEVGEKKQNRYHDRVFLADYQKYVDQTIIYDQEYHIFICILRDVTEEVVRRETREAFNREALAITDRVIEKQMRTVQEIASLLGETTAETKIALTRLKESLNL